MWCAIGCDQTEADPDADLNGAVADPAVAEEAWAAWREEVALAEQFTRRMVDVRSPPGRRQDWPLPCPLRRGANVHADRRTWY